MFDVFEGIKLLVKGYDIYHAVNYSITNWNEGNYYNSGKDLGIAMGDALGTELSDGAIFYQVFAATAIATLAFY